MADETGRNLEQPDFLREKEAAEHKPHAKPSTKKGADKPREAGDEQVVDSAVENTFRH